MNFDNMEQYGAYPWIAAIVLGNQTFVGKFDEFQILSNHIKCQIIHLGTGVLIDQQHVLTTAHKLNGSL